MSFTLLLLAFVILIGSGAKILVRNVEWQFPLHFYLMKLSQTIYE
ncbi:hypothetical protein [Bacillus pseudomycoides]|nr:hypothetical protein [Bacillus pseudomycoides]